MEQRRHAGVVTFVLVLIITAGTATAQPHFERSFLDRIVLWLDARIDSIREQFEADDKESTAVPAAMGGVIDPAGQPSGDGPPAPTPAMGGVIDPAG